MRGRRPDGWSRIDNFHISCTRVRTKAIRRLDGDIWIVILALRRHSSRRDTTSSGRLIDLPFLGTWKESKTVRKLRGVRTFYWNVQTDASWIEASRYSEESGRKERRPDGWCWSVWRPDGMARRPDGWNNRQMGVRTGWHIVQTADRELEFFNLFHSAESSENALISGIPVYNIFYK